MSFEIHTENAQNTKINKKSAQNGTIQNTQTHKG